MTVTFAKRYSGTTLIYKIYVITLEEVENRTPTCLTCLRLLYPSLYDILFLVRKTRYNLTGIREFICSYFVYKGLGFSTLAL